MADTKLTALITALDAYGIEVEPKSPVVVTPPPTTVESPDGTEITVGHVTGQLVDSNKDIWDINAQRQITRNGIVDTATQRVNLLSYKRKVVFQRNDDMNWWGWINNGWVGQGTTDPRGTGTVPSGTGTQPTGQPGKWLTLNASGTEYILLLPDGYDPQQPTPVLLYLHQLQGDGQLQGQIDAYFNSGNAGADFRARHRCIVVAPKCPGSSAQVNWGGVDQAQQPCQQGALAVLADVERKYLVDTNRVYITGPSMGGIGTWDLLYKHADLFAAGMPLAGNDYALDASAVAQRLKDKPIWAVHSGNDPQVPVGFDRAVYAEMQRIGGKMKYTEMNVGHDVWDTVYTTPDYMDWMFQQSLGGTTTSSGSSGGSASGGTGGSTGGTTSIPSGVGIALSPGALSTRGSQIVDSNGIPQRIASIGWNQLFDNIDRDVAVMRKLGFNCVRVSYVNAVLDDDLRRIDKIMAACGRNNMRVIIDHHTNEVGTPSDGWGSQQRNGLPYDSGPGTDGTNGNGIRGTVSRDRFVGDWVRIANRYKASPAFLGCDLTNEPLAYPGMCTWGDGGVNDLRDVYQRAGNAILAVTSDVLIICEGPQNYNNGCPWGDLTGVKNSPVTLTVPNKVVYSVHDYPKYIAGFTPDSGSGKTDLAEKCWGYIVRQGIAPVWIGEMGANMADDGQRAWGQTLLDYMDGFVSDAQRKQGWQPPGGDWWAWGQLDGQLPNGMLSNYDAGTPRPEQKPYWQRLLFNR